MKAFIVLSVLFATLIAVKAADENGEYCFNQVAEACAATSKAEADSSCNAKYGNIKHLLGDLQRFTNMNIHRSFDYLLMSAHFSNYEKNRAGFEKTFRELSDQKWNQAIELIQHITKRGGSMDFKNYEATGEPASHELFEYQSMAQALDIEKRLAAQTFGIHKIATEFKTHDPEIAHYIEEEFAEKQSGVIRKLSGYTNDLDQFLKSNDKSIALYLFDEYLAKQSI